MFDFIKRWEERKKLILSIKENKARQKRYVAMSSSEFGLLTENELFEAALARTEAKVDKFEEIIDGVMALPHAQQVFYVTSYYEMEVNNGGLCQFFVNSSHVVAPFLSKYLNEIHAEEHKRLYDSFISNNQIDVNNLTSFIINNANEFEAQNQRYPFDDFDNAFYELRPIQEMLVSYVKEHSDEF